VGAVNGEVTPGAGCCGVAVVAPTAAIGHTGNHAGVDVAMTGAGQLGKRHFVDVLGVGRERGHRGGEARGA